MSDKYCPMKKEKCGGCPKTDPCAKCKGFKGCYLYDELIDAVVTITTVTNVTTSESYCDRFPDPFNPPEGLHYGKDIVTIVTQGNGFFLKGYKVVCPAQLVLLPPNINTQWNTYPFEENEIKKNQDGCNQERVDKIFITVTGVGKCRQKCKCRNKHGKCHNVYGKTMIYEGKLQWVHGSGDLAVLKIKNCNACSGDNFNTRVDLIKLCGHPYLEIGNSRPYKPGNKVHIMGGLYATAQPNLRAFTREGNPAPVPEESFDDYRKMEESEEELNLHVDTEEELSEDEEEFDDNGYYKSKFNPGTGLTPLKKYRGKQYSSGTVADSKYIDPNGMAQMEMLAVSADGQLSYGVGAVVLNSYGNVISYITMNTISAMDLIDSEAESKSKTWKVGGGFKTITKTRVKVINPFNGNGIIAGPASKYFLKIYKKMTEVVARKECDVPFAEIMESKFGNYYRYLKGYLGVAWEVYDAMNMLMHYNRDGVLVPNYGECGWEDLFCSHRQVGLIVKSVAGQRSPRNARAPGPHTNGTVPYSFTVADDLNLEPNDIIIKAGKCELGAEGGQVSLGFILSRKYPGECITLSVSKRDCGYPTQICSYVVELVKEPPYVDFPWYSYFQYKLNTYPTSGIAFNSDLPVIRGAYFLPSS